MKAMVWMVAIGLGLAACDGSMMSDPDQMRSMIDAARVENGVHLAETTGARSLSEMHGEMTRHDDAMDDMMGRMGMAMDGMSHCAGAGTHDLREMHDDMMGEMDQHASVMGQVTDLDAAMDEVMRHSDAMDGMLDRMDEATARMDCM